MNSHKYIQNTNELATKTRGSIGAAGENAGIEGDTGTAATVTSHRLVRKSVGVVAAAFSSGVASVRVVLTVIDDTFVFLVKTVRVLESVRDGTAGNKQIEHFDDEDTLDFAGVFGTTVAVESVAGLDKSGLTTTGS